MDHVVINLQVDRDSPMKFEHHLESLMNQKENSLKISRHRLTSMGMFDLISSISSSTDEKIKGGRPKRHSENIEYIIDIVFEFELYRKV